MTDTDLIARLRDRRASHIGDGQLPDALCQAAADALAAALTRAELAERHAEAMDEAHERELFDAARVAIEMQMDATGGQHVNPQLAVDEVIAARAVLDGKTIT